MENSGTSMSKTLSPNARTVNSGEESSWTFYFENFLCNNNEHSSLSSGYECPSQVSDAASSVAKKFMGTPDHQVGGFSLDKNGQKLSLKKRKTKGPLVDDALEDTASSPVNSPKICYLNQLEMNGKEKDNTDILEERGNTSGQMDERNELGNVGRDSDHTELKKKRLCLVPMTMLANYLG